MKKEGRSSTSSYLADGSADELSMAMHGHAGILLARPWAKMRQDAPKTRQNRIFSQAPCGNPCPI